MTGDLKRKMEKQIAFDLKEYARRFGKSKLIVEVTKLTLVDKKGKYAGCDYDIRFNDLNL